MYNAVVDFLSRHLGVTGLIVSGMWFYAGNVFVVEGKEGVGLSWQIIGVVILGAFCVNATLARSWYSALTAVAGISLELWLIRRRLSRNA